MRLFTKNNCSACENVKAYLKDQNIDVEIVNIQKDYAAAAGLVDLGYRSVPILQKGADYYVGAEAIKSQI